MNKQQIELSKQLVALGLKDEKYFRWMPGMRDYWWSSEDKHGSADRFIEHFGFLEGVDGDGCAEFSMPDGSTIPDFTDPATAGCLESILNGLRCEQHSGPSFVYVTLEDELGTVRRPAIRGDCIGEARAKAIIAIAQADGVEAQDDK